MNVGVRGQRKVGEHVEAHTKSQSFSLLQSEQILTHEVNNELTALLIDSCKVSDITFLPLTAQHVDEKDQLSGILTSSGNILHTNFSGRVLVRLCWVYGKTRPPPLQKNHKVVSPPPKLFLS